jgi:lipopolysaccharide export LptBFGC system permease protein LptF
MGNTPGMDSKRLLRGQVAVLLLVLVGIGLFALLWQGMGAAGVANAPRLLVSICLPPAIIAIVIGVYFLVVRTRG